MNIKVRWSQSDIEMVFGNNRFLMKCQIKQHIKNFPLFAKFSCFCKYGESVNRTRFCIESSWNSDDDDDDDEFFKTCLQDVLRRLQRNNFLSSKTSSKTSSKRFQDVFKTSSRSLGRRKIVTLKTCWRRVFKTSSRCLQDQQMFAGMWVSVNHSWR